MWKDGVEKRPWIYSSKFSTQMNREHCWNRGNDSYTTCWATSPYQRETPFPQPQCRLGKEVDNEPMKNAQQCHGKLDWTSFDKILCEKGWTD